MTATQTILLTGFEPFGGEAINPSWEAIKQLDGRFLHDVQSTLATTGTHYQLACRRLPCVFELALQDLRQHLRHFQPILVLAIGQAGGRSELSIEKVAINHDDARIPDNIGQQPIDQPINPQGPKAYFSNLPLKAIVQAWQMAAIPGSISYTAGTYVCNHVFYGLMDFLAQHQLSCRAGFLHIPYLPAQVCDKRQQPSMSLDLIQQGILSALCSSVLHQHDIALEGGSTH